MERIPVVNELLVLVRAGLENKLAPQGFEVVYTKDEDDLYGSCFMIWSDNSEMIRLTWNGLEKTFQLDTSKELPFSSESRWETLSVTGVDPSHKNMEYLLLIAETVVLSLDF